MRGISKEWPVFLGRKVGVFLSSAPVLHKAPSSSLCASTAERGVSVSQWMAAYAEEQARLAQVSTVFVCDGRQRLGGAVCMSKSADCRRCVFITAAHVLDPVPASLWLEVPSAPWKRARFFGQITAVHAVAVAGGDRGSSLRRHDACAMVLEVDQVFPELEELEVFPLPGDSGPGESLERLVIPGAGGGSRVWVSGDRERGPYIAEGAFVVHLEGTARLRQGDSGLPLMAIPWPPLELVCKQSPRQVALQQVPTVAGLVVGLSAGEEGGAIVQPVSLPLRELLGQLHEGRVTEEEARRRLEVSSEFDEPHEMAVDEWLAPPRQQGGVRWTERPLRCRQLFVFENAQDDPVIPWVEWPEEGVGMPKVMDILTGESCDTKRIKPEQLRQMDQAVLESHRGGIRRDPVLGLKAFNDHFDFFPRSEEYLSLMWPAFHRLSEEGAGVRPEFYALEQVDQRCMCEAWFDRKEKEKRLGTRVLLDPVECVVLLPSDEAVHTRAVWVTDCHYGDDHLDVRKCSWLRQAEGRGRGARRPGAEGSSSAEQQPPRAGKQQKRGKKHGEKGKRRRGGAAGASSEGPGAASSGSSSSSSVGEPMPMFYRANSRECQEDRDKILERIKNCSDAQRPWYPFQLLGWLNTHGDQYRVEPPEWIVWLPGQQ